MWKEFVLFFKFFEKLKRREKCAFKQKSRKNKTKIRNEKQDKDVLVVLSPLSLFFSLFNYNLACRSGRSFSDSCSSNWSFREINKRREKKREESKREEREKRKRRERERKERKRVRERNHTNNSATIA